MRKADIRKTLLEERKALGTQARICADVAIASKVLASEAWKNARIVYAYLSFGSEVDTRQLIRAAWTASKVVALPCCVPGTRRLRWYTVRSFDGLVCSKMGMEEPCPDSANEVDGRGDATSLALVPGLAFDSRGFRLGYGGGFYDKFLDAFEGVSIGLCRACSYVDDLSKLGAIEDHDVAVDEVAVS